MKRFTFLGIITLIIGIMSVAAQDSDIFVGNWDIDLGATASMNTTTRQVDRTTVERTTTTTIGKGAKGMGSLQINADCTYRLNYFYYEQIYNQSVIEGNWRRVQNGKSFADVGAIELLDAVPDKSRSSEMRKWYVFQKEDGAFEARYPPHDGYAKIKLTKAGGKTSSKLLQREVKDKKNVQDEEKTLSEKTPPASEKPRTWTPDEIRKHLAGKTKQEVFELLGKPVKESYGTYSFNGVDKKFPPCPNGCNYKSFAIRFDNAGGTVSSVELQYWLVE